LDHAPLAPPGLVVARDEVIPERQRIALHDQSFSWKFKPIPPKDVLAIFLSADRIGDASVDSRPEDVAVALKVLVHPMEQFVSQVKLFCRSGWNQATLRLRLIQGHTTDPIPKSGETSENRKEAMLAKAVDSFRMAVEKKSTRPYNLKRFS
jgi:hypothetical protein